MSDYVKSVIRTVSSYIVAVLAKWLAEKLGFQIDEAGLTEAFIVIFGAVWYGIIRLLEQKFPKLGWLIGWNTRLTYTKPN